MRIADRILRSRKPLVLLHTYSVTESVLRQAISEAKSMDLDVCVDDQGRPYVGHSHEYHDKSGDPWPENMPLWDAVELLAGSGIAAIVDCKHHRAWPVVAEVVDRIGAELCLVHAYAEELRFDHSRGEGEPDFTTEWSPIERLSEVKASHPGVSTCASCKWLPKHLSVAAEHTDLLERIRATLVRHRVDTVCLNIHGDALCDELLAYFLGADVIPHVGIDNTDVTRLTLPYVGETDRLSAASVTVT